MNQAQQEPPLLNEQKGLKLKGLKPLVYADTRLVILGSFPGQASLDAKEYYAFKRNHFWSIVGDLINCPDLKDSTYQQKKAVLKKHKIGLWDVYASCYRVGSLDVNITHGEPNDLSLLAKKAKDLRLIAHNGATSAKFKKITKQLGVDVIQLPSTSPANASWSYARKLDAWRDVFVRAGVV